MRIPTSVFVMTTVTALPFGIAIRDTTRPPPIIGDQLLTEDVRNRFQLAEDTRATEARLAEQHRVAATNAAWLDKVMGPTPGALGSAFAGVELGRHTDIEPAPIEHLNDLTTSYRLSWFATSDLAQHIVLARNDDDDCNALETAATAHWGASLPLDLHSLVWFDPATGARAVLDDSDCRLVFDRALALDHYVGRGDELASPAWIGAPAAKLLKQLGNNAQDQVDSISWEDEGLADGAGVTTAYATVHDGKITGLELRAIAPARTIDQLRARLTKLLGKPQPDLDDNATRWSGATKVRLEDGGTEFTLYLGSSTTE